MLGEAPFQMHVWTVGLNFEENEVVQDGSLCKVRQDVGEPVVARTST